MTQIVVPRLGVTVTEIRIVEWFVGDGESVAEGDPLIEIATDKVNQDIPAPAGGTVRHLAAAEDVCAVGAVIGEIA